MSDPTSLDILRGTKTVLQKRGWQQFEYGDTNGPVCLRGAVNVASGANNARCSLPAGDDAYLMLRKALLARGEMGPIGWNDAPDRTVEDVYALIDEAIVLAEAGDHDA